MARAKADAETARKDWPHDDLAETRIIGACLWSETATAEAIEAGLESKHFYIERRKDWFAAMERLHAQGLPVDLVTVRDELVRAGVMHDMDGQIVALSAASDDQQGTVGLRQWVAIVVREWRRRQVLERLSDLQEQALESADLDRLADETAALSEFARPPAAMGALILAGDALNEMLEHLEREAVAPTSSPIPTPWSGLNALLGGGWCDPSRPYILAARPKVGKTSAALAAAWWAAASGHTVVYFSGELGRFQLMQRLTSIASGVPHEDIRRWSMIPDDEVTAIRTIGEIQTTRLHIDSSAPARRDLPKHLRRPVQATMTIDGIRGVLKALTDRERVHLVIIDYLQLIKGRAGWKMFDKVTAASNGCREIVQEFGIPTVVVAQIRRPSGGRDTPPTADELKGTGDIEQDCSAAILADRPYMRMNARQRQEATDEEKVQASLVVDINGAGPTGEVRCIFHGDCMRWLEVTDRYDETMAPRRSWAGAADYDEND